MKIYYAHCQAIYDTKQEDRDIVLLESMGFEVMNPNSDSEIAGLETFKKALPDTPAMEYFLELVKQCDALAFRATPSGKIPAGIYKEIHIANIHKLPVIELPSMIQSREMTVARTSEYLYEMGQR